MPIWQDLADSSDNDHDGLQLDPEIELGSIMDVMRRRCQSQSEWRRNQGLQFDMPVDSTARYAWSRAGMAGETSVFLDMLASVANS